ncbi:MAG: hypothetical protein ACYTE3_11835 [Planctomycetota bacterium]|jgi:hypothetical protein
MAVDVHIVDSPATFSNVKVVVGEKAKGLVILPGQHQDHDLAQKTVVALGRRFMVVLEEGKASFK